MTIPHDDADWTPSSLTGSDSSLTGSALEGGSSTWASSSTGSFAEPGSATSSTGPGWSSGDPPLPSTARQEAETSLRLDSISTPSQQGPVSARIGRELLGDPSGAAASAGPPAPAGPLGLAGPPGPAAPPAPVPSPQPVPAPQSSAPQPPPPPADPAAYAPPEPTAYAPPDPTPDAPPESTPYAPPESTPYAPESSLYAPPESTSYAPPNPNPYALPEPARSRGTGRIRSMADLERAKQEYEQGYGARRPRTASRRNGAYSTLVLGLIAAGVVAVGWVAGDPAPGSSIYLFGGIAIITGLTTVAKPVDPPTRNRVMAVIGMALAVAAFVVHIVSPW